MEKEVININPALGAEHRGEFLEFCKVIKKNVNRKGPEQRQEVLFKIKDDIFKTYAGKNFHKNTDIAFVKSLVIDLLLQDWEIEIKQGQIRLVMAIPTAEDFNIDEEKAKTRRRHLLARDSQLREPSVAFFIQNMERRRLTLTGWHSIFSVMRDGPDLSDRLKEINTIADEKVRIDALTDSIKPYIQIAEPGVRCNETGLLLSEIWRYFRHTWINEYKSLPGRSISILIRDAAAPNHPVIGIAALGSSVAQQTCRDEWIGWDGKKFIERIKQGPSAKIGKWIINKLSDLFKEIYLSDFYKEGIITRADLKNPSPDKIKYLRDLAIKYRAAHTNNPHTAKFSVDNAKLNWKSRAQSNLFKSKRAVLLAELLTIKLIFNKYEYTLGSKSELTKCLEHRDFCIAVERLIRKAKSIQVGINMMDIIVCGSIAPYNQILGGKLICMLLTSPEISHYYNKKYAAYTSLIASSMAGKAIIRKPHLVLLGTTSLYGAGSSQYNRIKIPSEEIGGHSNTPVEYKELGFSEGFGSFHFSATTIKLADAVVGRLNGRKRVNMIFGEGANPLIRKLKDAMEYLKLESNPILNHRNKRVVYGITLCENFGDVMIGLDERPKYLIPQNKPKAGTEMISKFWIKRWLNNRAKKGEILNSLEQHSLSYPITHGARVPIKREESPTLF